MELRKQTLWEKLRPYVFILPAMIFLVIFVVYPVIDVIVRSFQEWNMIKPPKWVGWKNYQ